MSHLTQAKILIKDLADLEAAAKKLGGTFVRGQSTYRWYGKLVGRDAKLPEGMTVDQLGKCDHAIKLAGVNYEVGVARYKDGYRLLFDSYNSQPYSVEHDGHKLVEKFGEGLGLLTQRCAAETVLRAAKRKGVLCSVKTLSNGSLQLRMSV